MEVRRTVYVDKQNRKIFKGTVAQYISIFTLTRKRIEMHND